MSIEQYYVAELWVGLPGSGYRIPILPGFSLVAPENYDSPDAVTGNLFDANDTGGLKYPIVSTPVGVTSDWWGSSNLNSWFNTPRGAVSAGAYVNGPYFDVASIGTVYYWNGTTLKVLTGAKVMQVQIGSTLGAYCDARIDIWGTSITTLTSGSIFSQFPSKLTFSHLAAKSKNTSHTLPKNPSRWDITLRNNLILNDEIPSATNRQSAPYSSGTYNYDAAFEMPLEHNSTRFEAMGQATFQRSYVDSILDDDGSGAVGNFNINVWAPQYSAGAAVKTNAGVTLTVNSPRWTGREGQTVTKGRQRTTLGMMGRMIVSGANAGTDPVTISAWTPT